MGAVAAAVLTVILPWKKDEFVTPEFVRWINHRDFPFDFPGNMTPDATIWASHDDDWWQDMSPPKFLLRLRNGETAFCWDMPGNGKDGREIPLRNRKMSPSDSEI